MALLTLRFPKSNEDRPSCKICGEIGATRGCLCFSAKNYTDWMMQVKRFCRGKVMGTMNAAQVGVFVSRLAFFGAAWAVTPHLTTHQLGRVGRPSGERRIRYRPPADLSSADKRIGKQA